MSKIERALKKIKKDFKKKKEQSSSSVEKKETKVDHVSTRNTTKDDSTHDYLTIQSYPNVPDSKPTKRDMHITSAVKKDKKGTILPNESSVDHNKYTPSMTDTVDNLGVIQPIKETGNGEQKREDMIPSTAIGSYNVNERIVAYYDSVGKQTWEGPVMVHFRRLQVTLSKIHKKDMCKVMMFTSATQKEGKSIVALNTALTLCNDKQSKVVFINCDFRKQVANKLLGFNAGKGLTDYLIDKAEFKEISYNGLMPNFTMIPAGKTISNVCEKLASDKMKQFLSYLKERFDYVIMDTPPVLAFPDNTIIAPLVDGVIFVVNCKKTRKKVVKRAIEILHDCKIIGCVMNEGEIALDEYYGYSYGHYYQEMSDL